MERDGQDAEARLYQVLGAVTARSLPNTSREAVRALVLDHLACRVHGLTMPWTGSAWRALRESGVAPAEGEEGLTPFSAAYLGGTAAHAFDFDDTHLPTMTHPGAVVIPAVAAAARLAPDGDVLGAIAAGYEAMARITAALGREFGDRGFHATGQVGAMAAAVAVSRQLALPPASLARALGAAASMGAGIKAFVHGPGNIKRLHAGHAAAHGLLAAVLERQGLSGPDQALTGAFGFLVVHGAAGSLGAAALGRDLGPPYAVDEVHLKRYPACAAVHGAVLAASRIGPLTLRDIDSVTVGTSARALAQNSIPRPHDSLTAQYSTEFAVATALLGDPSEVEPYADPTGGAAGPVRALAADVRLVLDQRSEAAYPTINAARVDVVLRGGRVASAYAEVSATASPAWSDAEAKFLRLTSSLVDASSQQRALASVRGLESGHDLLTALAALPGLPFEPPAPAQQRLGVPAESAAARE